MTAKREEEAGEGKAYCLDTFSIRETALWGSPRNFGAPLPLPRREGPHRVEFPALIRHYAIFKSGPRGIFRSNELLPPFSSTPSNRDPASRNVFMPTTPLVSKPRRRKGLCYFAQYCGPWAWTFGRSKLTNKTLGGSFMVSQYLRIWLRIFLIVMDLFGWRYIK